MGFWKKQEIPEWTRCGQFMRPLGANILRAQKSVFPDLVAENNSLFVSIRKEEIATIEHRFAARQFHGEATLALKNLLKKSMLEPNRYGFTVISHDVNCNHGSVKVHGDNSPGPIFLSLFHGFLNFDCRIYATWRRDPHLLINRFRLLCVRIRLRRLRHRRR